MHLPMDQQYLPESTAFVLVPADELTSPQIATGMNAWDTARGLRRFPKRSEIRPRDIVTALQHMALLKVENGDFYWRIVGDGIVRAFDLPLQNRPLSEIVFDEPGFQSILIPLLREVRQSGEPIAVRGTIGHDVLRANFTDYENLLLPLGPDDSTVDHVMMFAAYSSRPYLPKRFR